MGYELFCTHYTHCVLTKVFWNKRLPAYLLDYVPKKVALFASQLLCHLAFAVPLQHYFCKYVLEEKQKKRYRPLFKYSKPLLSQGANQ